MFLIRSLLLKTLVSCQILGVKGDVEGRCIGSLKLSYWFLLLQYCLVIMMAGSANTVLFRLGQVRSGQVCVRLVWICVWVWVWLGQVRLGLGLSLSLNLGFHQKCPRKFTKKMSMKTHPKKGPLMDILFTKSMYENSPILCMKIHLLCP